MYEVEETRTAKMAVRATNFGRRCRSGANHLVERRRQELHVMHVGPARDERQRDATPVD